MVVKTKVDVSHPLDPLTSEEVERARDILESEHAIGDRSRYVKIVLDEPSKDELSAYEEDGADVDRQAFIIIRDRDEKTTYEAVISLDHDEVLSWKNIEGVQPSVTLKEFDEVEEVVKQNPEWREAAAKRGVEDFDLAIVDPWSVGHHLVPDDIDRDRRLVRGRSWIRTHEDDNGYARPLGGIHAFVDLDDMEVVKVLDNGVKEEDVVNNLRDAEWREEERELRTDLKPYNVDQPDGPSWEIEGKKVEWQNWEMRIGWTHREGLVIHDIRYNDGDESRKIAHRASCAEMAVPYGDPDPNYNWQNAFDVGEYNIGRLANSLTEGCDCLGHMHYMDAVLNNTDGEPNVIPNAVCIHEEDYGMLWKHSDWRTGDQEVRRNRRLTVSFVATVANYDYAFYWYFYQDGSVQGQVRLTGIDSNGLLAEDETVEGYAEEIAPQVKGMLHQHFFNFRLDLDIDGTENKLYRRQNVKVPYGPDDELNPAGQAFYSEKELLEREQDAQDLFNPQKGRYWQIENPNKTNYLDKPVGYKLEPHENVVAGAQPGSSVMERSEFIDNHLWATPYREDERFPAGDYPNQSPGGEGLPKWTKKNRSIDEEDMVLWYTLGVNHVTRPEDWPILPVEIANFKLKPVNFFDENPAMDVPPEHAIKDIQSRREEKYDDPDSVATGDDD